MRLVQFGNFEPGSGLGCADDCGLGALLPVIPANSVAMMGGAQYNALAGGGTSGGNFQHFKDGAELGWFTDDQAGYTNYLAWNSLGIATNKAQFQALPDGLEYIAWQLATVFAYAVVAKMHVGNNLSPIYDPTTASAQGIKSLQGVAQNYGWTPTQLDRATQLFSDHFKRLLVKWGYKGTISAAPVPVMIKNPYFESLGQTVWVDKNTVTFDGADDRPGIIGGRMFSAGGVTWRWGGTTVAVPPTKYLMIFASRLEQPQYDERGWTMYPVYAWRTLERGGKAAGSSATLPDKYGPLVKWTGEYLNYADTGPMGSLYWLEDMSAADAANIRALGGASMPPSKAEWGWGKNTNMPTGAPQNPVIPITDPRNPNYKPPTTGGGTTTPNVNPWTDVTAPPPPQPKPPSSGSQPIIPVGVPPVETTNGTLVPSMSSSGMSPDAIDVPMETATAGVDAGSIGKGTGVALLGGLAVLLLLSKRRRR